MRDLRQIKLKTISMGKDKWELLKRQNQLMDYVWPKDGGICSAMNLPEWERTFLFFPNRCPSYEEMCHLKDMFWDDNEIVMQIHPKKKDYVNVMQYALHLWRDKITNHEAEMLLKDAIQMALEDAKEYYEVGKRKEIFIDDFISRLVIFCGDDWLSWEEICKIKQNYYGPEKAAIQFNISSQVDLNKEHIILLWDAENFDLPPKEIV